MHKIASLLSVVFLMGIFAACGESSGMNNNQNNVNTNENSNLNANENTNYNVNPGVNLTREMMVVSQVHGIIRYNLDSPDAPCDNIFPDVNDSPENIRLCRALTYLYSRGVMPLGQTDGQFHKNDDVIWAETWKFTVNVMGFMLFPGGYIPDGMIGDEWYFQYMTTLSHKGFTHWYEVTPGNYAPMPGELISGADWNETLADIDYIYNREAFRPLAIETLLVTQSYVPFDPTDTCEAPFSDVSSGTMRCFVAQEAIEQGVIDPEREEFGSYDYIGWPELFVMIARIHNIEDNWDLTCVQHELTQENTWWLGKANALCKRGMLPNEYWPNVVPKQYVVSRWLFQLQSMNI